MEKIRIFVADDSPAAREMLIRILSDQPDMEVVDEAGSGQACLIMLDETSPDIVILEASIGGGMNLVDIVKEIKRIQPNVAVIICTDTVSSSNDKLVEAAKIGAHEFISKPYNSVKLLRTIREVYASQHA